MEILSAASVMREQAAAWRRGGLRVAFVPTMGNLHDGHLRLVKQAETLADRVVVSIFVNPKQFSDNEDLDQYPVTFEEDRSKLRHLSVSTLFYPQAGEIYPGGVHGGTYVEVPELSDILCGASRPGHFRGVATVVSILFNIVRPDVALFGEKDYQQLLVIQRMVNELHMNIEIVSGATVRDGRGLALSSRNSYLSPQEMRAAPGLYQVLTSVGQELVNGRRDFSALEEVAVERLRVAGFSPEYVAVRRTLDLGRPHGDETELVVLAAARLGKARLIDNIRVDLKPIR